MTSTYTVENKSLGNGRTYFARRGWYVCPAGYSYGVGDHWFSDKFVSYDATSYLQSACYSKSYGDLKFSIGFGGTCFTLSKFPVSDFEKFSRSYIAKHGWYLCPVFCDKHMRVWYTLEPITKGEHRALVYYLKDLAGILGGYYTVNLHSFPQFYSYEEKAPTQIPVRKVVVYKSYFLPK